MDDQFTFEKQFYEKYLSILSESSLYTFQNPRIQYFSLPSEVILRIFYQKRSPLFLLKLYQTCKYFFKKLSILPICSCQCSRDHAYYGRQEYNINKKVLFWFYNDLSLIRRTLVLERIYYCNLETFVITNFVLTFDDFQKIVTNSNIFTFCACQSNIIYSNGSTVPLNVILQMLPNCVKFSYDNESELFSKEVLFSINKLEFLNPFNKISIRLHSVSYDFDPILFWKFLKKNTSPNSLLSIKNPEQKEIDENIRATFKRVFSDWNGKEPRVFIYPKIF